MKHPRYVTKGDKLYEVLERKVVRNAGITAGSIVEYMLLDVTTEDAGPFIIGQDDFATYEPVSTEDAEAALYFPIEPHPRELERFRESLERWGEEAPAWMA